MYVKEMQLSIIEHVKVDICGWFMDITRNLTHKLGEREMISMGVWKYAHMEPTVCRNM